MRVCMLELNAAEQFMITETTSVNIAVNWTLPAGYYDGFTISAVPSLPGAVNNRGTVYGEKNCVQLYHCF